MSQHNGQDAEDGAEDSGGRDGDRQERPRQEKLPGSQGCLATGGEPQVVSLIEIDIGFNSAHSFRFGDAEMRRLISTARSAENALRRLNSSRATTEMEQMAQRWPRR